MSADGKSISLGGNYLDDDFDVTGYGKSIQTIDASAVLVDLNITGNKLANVITGTSEDDYIDGKAGKDFIDGGAGDVQNTYTPK